MVSERNKVIAKNTAFLYFRMILVMLVSLYTSRIILETLGETDYGVFNVVAGMVSMLTFLNSSVTGATQRFLTIELGKNNDSGFTNVFNTAIVIHLILAVIITATLEIAGIWFLNNKLNIPQDRMVAANYILHTATAITAIGIIQAPFNAAVIAHEKMNVYALTSILEVILKLAVVYLLVIAHRDKLIIYGFLSLFVKGIIFFIFALYCRLSFPGCRLKTVHEKSLYRQMLSFSGWNIIGSLAWMLKGQGGNILLNIFGGTAINAALGISSQVTTAVSNLISGFQTAVNPQITKNFASDEKEQMLNLMNSSAKISFYLMLCIVIPLTIEVEFVLGKWLVDVPAYSSCFTQIALWELLISTLSGPLITGLLATGNIKSYQIVIGCIMFLSLPISYILLKIGLPIYIPCIISVVITSISHMGRVLFAHNQLGLNIGKYIKCVLLPTTSVALLSYITPIVCYFAIKQGWGRLFLVISASVVCVMLNTIILGLDSRERRLIKSLIQNVIRHKSLDI